jgi:putative methyltransferase (TIGR04325 family)
MKSIFSIYLDKFVKRSNNHKRSFSSFKEALQDSDTYEDHDVIEIVSLKTQNLINSIQQGDFTWLNDHRGIQNLFVFSYIFKTKPLRVVEIGGACGALFFLSKHFVPDFFETWMIVETPAMVKKAKEKFENTILKFVSINDFEKEHSLQTGDILIAQGVLQYLENPLMVFDSLQRQNYQYIYLSRTVVGEGISAPIITKQVVNVSDHGPGEMPKGWIDRKTSQPLTILPLHLLNSKILDIYQILFLFDEGGSNMEYINNEKIQTKMIGILLKRKD